MKSSKKLLALLVAGTLGLAPVVSLAAAAVDVQIIIHSDTSALFTFDPQPVITAPSGALVISNLATNPFMGTSATAPRTLFTVTANNAPSNYPINTVTENIKNNAGVVLCTLKVSPHYAVSPPPLVPNDIWDFSITNAGGTGAKCGIGDPGGNYSGSTAPGGLIKVVVHS